MSHIPTLISDLALILVSAGVITLIFKKLKQPLVLGYIMAGFIASPHLAFTPSVIDVANVQTWADIGVIFLLFALGLDFSFKKLMKVGGPAVIAAITIIFGMSLLGISAGTAMGWKRMDCIFLGGMIAMSSTSIIYKALEDLGLRTKRFSSLVLGILVVEDIVAIVLMVMLSTMAVSSNFEGADMFYSIAKLLFFLSLWFIIGIYIIPTFFKRAKLLMNDETLLIVSLGLCLLMVVLAAKAGFSSALGAFVMGSILAETVEAEKIEHLIRPVKNLFAAIFFVSVGMMVDPAMIVEHAVPIIIITLTVLIGQAALGTFGVLLAGQPLKIAMQCGFCLTQIGEFAFIIATLGLSLNVTSNYLYPIVVAVSVITTFLTPYMMRFAEPAYPVVERHLPRRWRQFIERYTSGSTTVNQENNWKKLVLALIQIVTMYSVVIIAELIIAFNFLVPFIHRNIPGVWGSVLNALIIILCIAPFLRAIVVKKNHSVEFEALWNDNRFNRGYLVSLIVFRFVIAVTFVMVVIVALFEVSIALLLGIACLVVSGMVYSRRLKKQSIMIERQFVKNFNARVIAQTIGKQSPKFAKHLLSKDLHLSDFHISADSLWVGKSLSELKLGTELGVHIVAIFRGNHCINIPGGKERIYSEDKIQVIGSDEQLQKFGTVLESQIHNGDEQDLEQNGVCLRQFSIDAESAFCGVKIRDSRIREDFRCLVVGVERKGSSIDSQMADVVICEGDTIWIVGEEQDIIELLR